MTFLVAFSQFLLAAAVANASPAWLWRRGTLPNAQIASLPEAVPSGTLGDLYEAYQPYLNVYNGCVPSPAVDANGNTK